MNTPQTTIGLRFITERKRLKLTQSELSLKLGVSREVIIRHENRCKMLSIKTIEGLVALGFDMAYVLTGATQADGKISHQELALLELAKQAKAAVSLMNSQTLAQKLRHFSTSVTFFSAPHRFESLLSLLRGSSHASPTLSPSLASPVQDYQHPDLTFSQAEQVSSPQADSMPAETTLSATPQSVHLVVNLSTGESRFVQLVPVNFSDCSHSSLNS